MSKTIYTEIANPNGNFLFTVEQLNNAKTNDKCLPCECGHCGKIFYISRKNYISVVNKKGKGSFQFCSYECSHQHRIEHSTSITKPRLLCGKLVTKTRYESLKYPNFFCCSSHAATYNNNRRSPRSEESRAKTSLSMIAHIKANGIAKTRQNHKFKSGQHTAWNGRVVEYHSSYELDYCHILDEQHIDYTCETLNITYWDTRLNKYRVAIPDFFLIEEKTLVEIKSSYTYDYQNMVDKSLQYKKLGYNFKLILNHQEYDYCPDIGDHQTIYSHKQ